VASNIQAPFRSGCFPDRQQLAVRRRQSCISIDHFCNNTTRRANYSHTYVPSNLINRYNLDKTPDLDVNPSYTCIKRITFPSNPDILKIPVRRTARSTTSYDSCPPKSQYPHGPQNDSSPGKSSKIKISLFRVREAHVCRQTQTAAEGPSTLAHHPLTHSHIKKRVFRIRNGDTKVMITSPALDWRVVLYWTKVGVALLGTYTRSSFVFSRTRSASAFHEPLLPS